MQIVLLCGGFGKRIKKIDNLNPKGMIEINNKPFIDYILKTLEIHQFSNIHFCLGFKSEVYLQYLKEKYPSLNYTYSIENEKCLLGTGGAIKNCINFLEDNFIIQYGDTILKIDYREFYKSHLLFNKPMSMSIINSEKTEEVPNLTCKKSSSGELFCIYNKQNPPLNANYIDYGALICKKEIFIGINENIFDLSKLQTDLSLKNNVNFFEVNEKYIEIGNPSSFEKAKLKLNDF